MSTQLQTAPRPPVAAARAAAAEFVGVSKTYSHPLFKGHRVEALRDVTLRIEPGEVCGGRPRHGCSALLRSFRNFSTRRASSSGSTFMLL